MPPVYLIGRFPPPIDGQTMATARLAALLDGTRAVHRLNVSPGDTGLVQADVRFRPGKALHYVRLRRSLQEALSAHPTAPVLWTSISPAPLGHLRDRLIVLPAFQPGQRVFAVIHWGNFDRVFQAAATALSARRMVRRLAGFVFLNDQLAERCAPWIPAEKRFVIPNTVDEAVHCTEAERRDKTDARRTRTTLRLLFLSNMIPSKGYLDVLHAVRILQARGLSLHAAFAGQWTSEEDREAFMAVVHEHGLQDIVTHHGGVSDRARIKALYRDADVFLLPSYYPTEAQPISIIEALNAGTPVITTRHAGIPEMVREGREALFVPPRNPEAIAKALQELAVYDQWAVLARSAGERFMERFSPAAVRAHWEALLATPTPSH